MAPGTWSKRDQTLSAGVCRFCDWARAELTDPSGRPECADQVACRAREVAQGLAPHQAVYAKGPVSDPDGPVCACGRRVFDPIHGGRPVRPMAQG